MEAQIISFLVVTCFGLVGVVYWIHRAEIDKLKDITTDHGKRIQKQEDVSGIKMDNIVESIKKLESSTEELKTKMQELSYNIHKEKNVESQLTQTLNLLLKELQSKHETN